MVLQRAPVSSSGAAAADVYCTKRRPTKSSSLSDWVRRRDWLTFKNFCSMNGGAVRDCTPSPAEVMALVVEVLHAAGFAIERLAFAFYRTMPGNAPSNAS